VVRQREFQTRDPIAAKPSAAASSKSAGKERTTMFEIIIKEVRLEETIFGKVWMKVGERFTTASDIKPSIYAEDQQLKKRLEAGEVVKFDVMGYTPETVKTVEKDREIYRQSVKELDLTEVIRAINHRKRTRKKKEQNGS
jgi:hypothetical protein